MSAKLHKKIDIIHRDLMPSSCKHLLRVIINDIDWNTGRGFKLGVNYCAEATSLSRRTIIRDLKILKRLHLLTLTRHHSARRGISAMYTLNLDVVDSLVTESKIIRMHHQTQAQIDKEENLKKACGKPVNKPLLGDKMAPTLGDKMAPSSLLIFNCINAGISKPVDNPPIMNGLGGLMYGILKRSEAPKKDKTKEELETLESFLQDCQRRGIEIPKRYDHLTEPLAA